MAGSPWVRPEDYLAAERRATEKHEYVNGRVVAMSGASKEHVIVASNLTIRLGNLLLPRGCTPMGSDMRVRVTDTGMYTYPDLSIVCGEGTYEDDQVDVLLDPVAIVEVLSKSTEAHDRGAKFAHYKRIPSLDTYVLVSSLVPSVDVFERREEGWFLRTYEGMEATMRLTAWDIEVPLADIYRGVEFRAE